jgi:osmotically-inducible protein OsmY
MYRPRSLRVIVLAGALLALAVSTLSAAPQGASNDSQLKAEIERKITDLKVPRGRVTVSVQDHVVMLDGMVQTLWDKYQIIDFSRKLEGITEVHSTIAIVKAENDTQLAQEVGKALRTYSHYTVFDYIDGNVNNAVVTLKGVVALSQLQLGNIVDKHSEIIERIQKIRGVQDLKDQIKVVEYLPSDDAIRYELATRIINDSLFKQYSFNNPPIHMVVDHGHVTLVGIVASPIERQKAYEIARSISGVFTVDNQVKTAAELKGQ